MKPGNAIEVKDLKITYKCVKSLSMRKSLFHLRKSKLEVYEALRGISFEVKKGEIMGIVGKNGSGKSTLLRAIAGIFSADSGSIELESDSVSLLSIGVGFQKKLSGRENIILSGMLLGFSEQEVRDKMDEIIEFANLGKFIDMPVKTYSSGMYSKLAFSITAVLETDIMLIDEVLSVGDAKFMQSGTLGRNEVAHGKRGKTRTPSTAIVWVRRSRAGRACAAAQCIGSDNAPLRRIQRLAGAY